MGWEGRGRGRRGEARRWDEMEMEMGMGTEEKGRARACIARPRNGGARYGQQGSESRFWSDHTIRTVA